MKVRRVVIGALLGTLVSFFWVNLSWTVLNLHNSSIRAFPDPTPIAEALRAQGVDGGIYVLPHMSADYNDKEGMAAHMTEMKEGPYMMGVVRSGSLEKEPEMGPFIARGIGIQGICVLIAAILLAGAANNLNYFGRVMFVVLLGFFAGATGHLPNWNWWHFPVDHTMVSIMDSVVSWLLAGLVMAAIIKPSDMSPDPADA